MVAGGEGAFREAKEAASLRAYADARLERRGQFYVCPSCGSGTHAHGTPALSVAADGGRWTCFSCNRGGDVFDLAGLWLESVGRPAGKAEQLAEVAAFAGVKLEGGPDGHARGERNRKKPGGTYARLRRQMEEARKAEAWERNRARHAEAVRRARERIGDPVAASYLASRGIGPEQAREWGLGYAPRSTRYGTPHIVIPYPGSEWYHADRSIRTDLTPWKYFKWPREELGPEPLWNPAALLADAFATTEGQLDALAVQSCGVEAVSGGGSGGTRRLMEEYGRVGSRAVCIVMRDTDEAGQRQAVSEAAELDAADIPCLLFTRWPMDGDRPRYKDAAEWFAADREGMAKELAKAKDEALSYREEVSQLRPAGNPGGAHTHASTPSGTRG